MSWWIGIMIVLIVIGAIVGIVLGVIIAKRNAGSNGSRSSSKSTSKGDLNKDSSEIKKLMNNPGLHKVFPGMDYTPLDAQYPACLSKPVNQNEVTKDVAVISQMTNRIRLYGTDCNQTEMVLHAIDRLDLKNDMKIWMGVWLDKNETTNARGLKHMYEILDKYKPEPFAGVIVGNEVLFRKDLTELELGQVLAEVKRNLTSKNIDLPVATSDLGDDWTAQLASQVDIVMSNVHPFFSGSTADKAAGWTWNFWQTHDVSLTAATPAGPKHIISEVGWPSGGGSACGLEDCTGKVNGSVAGIDEMNQFMEGWVCESMVNKTEYFWYALPSLILLLICKPSAIPPQVLSSSHHSSSLLSISSMHLHSTPTLLCNSIPLPLSLFSSSLLLFFPPSFLPLISPFYFRIPVTNST